MKKIYFYLLLNCCVLFSIGCSPEFTEKVPSDIDSWPTSPNYTFTHPCMLHTEADFQYVRQKVYEKKQPWLIGYEKLVESPRAKDNYTPSPKTEIKRGGGATGYNIIGDDGAAAYQLALMWKITGEDKYAKASINVMNQWAKTCKLITGSEAILVAGFNGYQYANAAEIMRTYEGWSEEDFNYLKQWLTDVFYPICHNFLADHNGANANEAWLSWDLPAMVTILSIGILCDDSDKVNEALNYFYNGSGAGCIKNSVVDRHKDPDGNVETFAQSQEMGRDQGHSTLNVPLHAYFCKMTLNAIGVDLFDYDNHVILDLCEYTAKYNLVKGVIPEMPFTPYYCHKTNEEGWHEANDPDGQGRARVGWELIYNHYKVKGLNPYYSKAFARSMRPEGGGHRGNAESDDLGFGTLMYTREPIEPGEDVKAEPVREY